MFAAEAAGHGAKLAKFELDREAACPFFDGTLNGAQRIKIQMAGS